MLHWDAVPTASRHGIILGYTVSYRTTFEVDDKVLVINDSITRPVELSGLHNYTFYTISLRAYNSKGNGTSGQITVQTDEDGEILVVIM